MKKKPRSLTVKKMSPAVYELRRKVIALVYEAKALVPTLPRLTVRITYNHESILAMAKISRDYIEVSDQAINRSDLDLRTIVFHEIIHAVFGVRHDEKCPLMKAHHTPLPKDRVHSLFLKYAGKARVAS